MNFSPAIQPDLFDDPPYRTPTTWPWSSDMMDLGPGIAREGEEDSYWYLATPYSAFPGTREEAFQFACRLAAQLIQKGRIIFSPIAHSHPIVQYGGVEDSHELWMRQDKALLEMADGLVVANGPWLAHSKGMQQEIEWARGWGMPIVYINAQGDLEEIEK